MGSRNKYITIDLLKYVPTNGYVELEPSFRIELFSKAIKNAGGRNKLAKLIGSCSSSIWEWKVGRKRPPLGIVFKCSKIAGISREELSSNIQALSSFFKMGNISVHKWKLVLNEEFAEWIGLIEGDGSITGKYVSCGNTFFGLVFFFITGLQKFFGIKKNQIVITIWIPPQDKVKNIRLAKLVKRLLMLKGFSRVSLRKRKVSEKRKAKRLLLEARVNVKILSSLFKNFMSDLKVFLKNSPATVKASYVAGFASAEGSITKDKNSRRFTISQKSLDKLLFIRELLLDLGFQGISDPEPNGKVFRISMSRRRELERYLKEIGFGHHELRNQKMREILSSYSQAEHKPIRERLNEVLNLLSIHGNLTGFSVAKKLKIKYKYANQLLNKMINLGLVKVDKSSKPFIYFLGESK